MAAELFRETTVGQLVHWLGKGKLLPYPEERADFVLPDKYRGISSSPSKTLEKSGSDNASPADGSTPAAVSSSATPARSSSSHDDDATLNNQPMSQSTDPEKSAKTGEPAAPKTKAPPGTIVVDWYDEHDPANPLAWSTQKKFFTAGVLCLLTFGVYVGSAIISSGIEDIMRDFGVSEEKATLTISLYVIGYGVGPLLFSPMSEIPRFGRNPFYSLPLLLFVAFQAGAATTPTFGGLLALRFITGFLGSPALATGGASMQDLLSGFKITYAFCIWGMAAVLGPSLGPAISGFAVAANGWRWSMWELLWITGFVCIVVFLALPETSGPAILHKRAARLRKLTGNPNIKSAAEVRTASWSAKDVFWDAIIKPTEIAIKDPAVLFAHVYIALVYAIYYLYFAVFPVVFTGIYGFELGTLGLAYISIVVGIGAACTIYILIMYFVVEPMVVKKFMNGEPTPPEGTLQPGLIGTLLPPIGLFIFAWTSRADIHWIVPLIGAGIYTAGVFIVFQVLFAFIGSTYPPYAASIFSGNDFFRSALAGGILQAGIPMFHNLSVGVGVSIVAALTAACIPPFYLLTFYGHKLRARSSFAVHDEPEGEH